MQGEETLFYVRWLKEKSISPIPSLLWGSLVSVVLYLHSQYTKNQGARRWEGTGERIGRVCTLSLYVIWSKAGYGATELQLVSLLVVQDLIAAG